jgi:hypothetical protein
MAKVFWNILKLSPALAATFLAANSALAGEVKEQVTSVAQLTKETNNIGQVTSVSQFSDVQPTDWAFQSLQSLVERYGCIAGYPNGTFRGNRALTRYEFAAGLNACLDRVNELIATSTADLVSKQDLEALKRLREDFEPELATLRGRVDALEARTTELEANQFSTTTKLQGEAIFNVSQVFGDKQADRTAVKTDNPNLDSNAVFSDRVRLSLNTSFTGKDQLQTRLQGRNIGQNSTVSGTNMTRLGYDGNGTNAVEIDKLNYAFNFSDKIRVKIDAAGAELNENVDVFNPDFRSSGTGALSRYGRFSPIYRLANDGAGITVNFTASKNLTFSTAYFARNRNSAADPRDGRGLFDGDNTFFGQLAFKPNKALGVGVTYARSYQATPNLFGDTGSALANGTTITNRIESDNYGIQLSFQPSAKITVGGWAGYTNATVLTTTGAKPKADVWYWAATLGVKDFGREGNTLGFIFGQPPKVTGLSNVPAGTNTDSNGTSYHLEGLYKMKLSDNILVTPGVLVIFNPEHNSKNDTIYVGTLRTTFSF